MPTDRAKLKSLAGANLPVNFPVGIWSNELGSIMNVMSASGGAFSGTYSSTVSGGGSAVTGVLAGTFSGEAIAFTVNWSPTQAVTAWTGVPLASAESGFYIYALWLLASSPAQDGDWWKSVLAGADLFHAVGGG